MKETIFNREPDSCDRQRWQEELAAPQDEARGRSGIRLFVFRCGGEWFGIDPKTVVLTDPLPPVHTVPHRAKALAGVVNLRGAVTLCFSLEEALQCSPGPASARPMLLALAYDGWQITCRVDEASGIFSFDPDTVTAPPATLSAGRHVTGLFSEGGRSIARLDPEQLFNTLKEAAR